MQKVTIKGHVIELYDSMDEMPVVRYHKFTQLMVLSAGVGNDLDAIRGKLVGIRQMIEDGKSAQAKLEVLNLYQTFAFIDKAIDPKSMALACLVKSIDGEEQEDISGDRLERLSAMLDKWATKKERDGLADSVKKKMEEELRYYYPEHTETDSEGIALMRRMLSRRVERILNGEDIEQKDPELESLARKMRDRHEVSDYSQYERVSDTAFEQGCLAITGELNKDAKTMTVMEYHSAMKLLEDRAAQIERARNK